MTHLVKYKRIFINQLFLLGEARLNGMEMQEEEQSALPEWGIYRRLHIKITNRWYEHGTDRDFVDFNFYIQFIDLKLKFILAF